MSPPESDPPEIPLSGGTANSGRVVRIGDQVARPAHPQSRTVASFLQHLQSALGNSVPAALGYDDLGRQRLRYVPGQAVMAPHSSWAFSDALLVQVADLQCRLHAAAESFVVPDDPVWAVTAGDYFPHEATGDLVCHNDLCMSNVIVDESDTTAVVGVIDFDYCRPVDRRFDIAVAARHWVPFGMVHGDALPDGLDRVARFALFCNRHGLSEDDRSVVIGLAISFLDKALVNVRSLADNGGVGFQQLLAGGYEATNRATTEWLNTHRSQLSLAT